MINSGQVLTNETLNNRLKEHIENQNSHRGVLDFLENHDHDLSDKLQIDDNHSHDLLLNEALNILDLHKSDKNVHKEIIFKLITEIVNAISRHNNDNNAHIMELTKFSMVETPETIGTKKNRLVFTGKALYYVK